VLSPVGLEIHQRGLGERDECARGRVEQRERDEEQPERRCAGRDPEREREAEAAADDERDEVRDGQQQPDLRVRQREVVADQRPRGFARAEDELVEQLDREQRRNDAAERSTDQVLPGRMLVHESSVRIDPHVV